MDEFFAYFRGATQFAVYHFRDLRVGSCPELQTKLPFNESPVDVSSTWLLSRLRARTFCALATINSCRMHGKQFQLQPVSR